MNHPQKAACYRPLTWLVREGARAWDGFTVRTHMILIDSGRGGPCER